MKTRATIHDIAREINVTASTVSRALNNHPAISESTKRAVHKKAKQLNYRRNKIASSLRSGKSHIWGVIIPSAEINFFGSVIHGIEKVAIDSGFNVLIYQSNELPAFEIKGLDTFLHSKVDGILASIAKETVNYDHYLEIKKRGIPLVLFDRANDELGFPSVVVNDYKGAYAATEHLIQQGSRRIAHIAGQQHIKIFNDRLRGYVDALKAHNYPVEDKLIVYGKVTIDSGRECMNQLIDTRLNPDGVFAVEDFTGLGAMQALKIRNIKIPAEVAIIGFANEAFSEYITPALSTVNQQTVKMGEEAARLLFRLSQKENFYKGEPEKIILEPGLIFRESSLKNNLQ